MLFVFTTVLSAAYPNPRMASLNHVLVITVTALVLASGFHYTFAITRRLSSSHPTP
jgi:hypothetical protein